LGLRSAPRILSSDWAILDIYRCLSGSTAMRELRIIRAAFVVRVGWVMSQSLKHYNSL
jgi:hypothetical protein